MRVTLGVEGMGVGVEAGDCEEAIEAVNRRRSVVERVCGGVGKVGLCT